MKKKLFIGTVLPTIAALGVIGSGFSLWIFQNDNTATSNGTIGVNVTKVVTAGTMTTVNNDMILNLDQPVTDLNAKGTGAKFIDDAGSIATLSQANLQYATYTKASDDSYIVGDSGAKYGDYLVDYVNGTTNITFTTTITVPAALAKYVTLATTGTLNGINVPTFTKVQASDADDAVYTCEYTADDIYAADNDFDFDSTYTVFDWDNVEASYTGSEPKSLEAYKTMLAAVKDVKISAEYKAVISVNA